MSPELFPHEGVSRPEEIPVEGGVLITPQADPEIAFAGTETAPPELDYRAPVPTKELPEPAPFTLPAFDEEAVGERRELADVLSGQIVEGQMERDLAEWKEKSLPMRPEVLRAVERGREFLITLLSEKLGVDTKEELEKQIATIEVLKLGGDLSENVKKANGMRFWSPIRLACIIETMGDRFTPDVLPLYEAMVILHEMHHTTAPILLDFKKIAGRYAQKGFEGDFNYTEMMRTGLSYARVVEENGESTVVFSTILEEGLTKMIENIFAHEVLSTMPEFKEAYAVHREWIDQLNTEFAHRVPKASMKKSLVRKDGSDERELGIGYTYGIESQITMLLQWAIDTEKGTKEADSFRFMKLAQYARRHPEQTDSDKPLWDAIQNVVGDSALVERIKYGRGDESIEIRAALEEKLGIKIEDILRDEEKRVGVI